LSRRWRHGSTSSRRTQPRRAARVWPHSHCRDIFLDATPFNIVEVDGGLVQIDTEWRVDRVIPLGWVITRSIVASLCGIAGFERDAVNVKDVIEALCVRHGLVVNADEISGWLARESELQSLSCGRRLAEFNNEMMSQRLVPLPERAAELAVRAETAAALEAEINLIYRSRSWRYSYPIRAIGRLLRKETAEPPPRTAGTADAIGHGLGKPKPLFRKYRVCSTVRGERSTSGDMAGR